jgi:GNAT superfamily N-acetyltransferase
MTRTAPFQSTLRLGTRADALCIGVLAIQVFLDTYATQGVRPSIAREVLEQFTTEAVSAQLDRADTTFVVAEAAGHMLGFAQLTAGAGHPRVTSARAAELGRLYVQPRFAGIGIGRMLLRRAESLAAEQGAQVLWLKTWSENHRARVFYARQGYEDVGDTTYEFQGEQYENRVLRRDITIAAAR